MTKTYTELREQTEQLNEFRILRAGAILAYANRVKQFGTRIEQDMRSASSDLSKIKQLDNVEDKLDAMASAMDKMTSAIVHQRHMIGSLTGVSVAAGLLAERTDKQIKQILKGKSRR